MVLQVLYNWPRKLALYNNSYNYLLDLTFFIKNNLIS